MSNITFKGDATSTQGLKTCHLSLPGYWARLLAAQIGESGFRVCNSSIHMVSVNLQ